MTAPCGKVCYATLGEVKDAAKALSRRPNAKFRHPPPARHYWCHACAAYHLTSIPSKKWKRRFKERLKRVKKGACTDPCGDA